MADLLSPAGKRFSWSFSALSQFDVCPRQYSAHRFYCTVKDQETDAIIWGKRVHKAIELRLRDGLPLTEEFAAYEPYCRSVEKIEGMVYLEKEVAFDRNLKVVDWFDPSVWGRGVIDVLVVGETKGWVIDWKTGKVKNDDTQLRMFCALAGLLYPDLADYTAKFVWLKHQQASGLDLKAQDIPQVWDGLFQRVAVMEKAWEHENFPCNPSGLCRGWCGVQDCKHWSPKR
jgi:PD-(D/E)XK nuclease superfamily